MNLHKTSHGFLAHISSEEALYVIQSLAERIRIGMRAGSVAELRIDNSANQSLTIEVMDVNKKEEKETKKRTVTLPPGAYKEA